MVGLGGSSVGWGWIGRRAICSDIHRKVPTDELSYWDRNLDWGVSTYLLCFPGDLQQM